MISNQVVFAFGIVSEIMVLYVLKAALNELIPSIENANIFARTLVEEALAEFNTPIHK